VRDVDVRDTLPAACVRARAAAARVGTAGTSGISGTAGTTPTVGLDRADVDGAPTGIDDSGSTVGAAAVHLVRHERRARRKTSHQQHRRQPDPRTRSHRCPLSRHRHLFRQPGCGISMPHTWPSQVAIPPGSTGQGRQEKPQLCTLSFGRQLPAHTWNPAAQTAAQIPLLQTATP
jgi:hypothetical protein